MAGMLTVWFGLIHWVLAVCTCPDLPVTIACICIHIGCGSNVLMPLCVGLALVANYAYVCGDLYLSCDLCGF